MKKFLSIIASVILLLPIMSTLKAKALNFPMTTPINSESAVLVNLDTGTIVHEKDADAKQLPGPLVNIMTAVVVLENCDDLSKEITLDPDVYTPVYNAMDDPDDLPSVDLNDGDVLTVEDLLYCMMLTSSVEASQSLAYYVGESDPDKFVKMMNDKAAEIGMNNTKFTNAHGMFDANQYTTARDMAVLTQYALNVPLFSTIACTVTYNPVVPNPDRHPNHSTWLWKHTNIMTDPDDDEYYMGAKGIKTANLTKAGRNIVVEASKDGNNYLAVLMKAPFSDADGNATFYACTLFDWAFSSFSYRVILDKSTEVGSLEVTLADGRDYILVRPKDEVLMLWCDDIDLKLIDRPTPKFYKDSVQAPVKAGEPLGTLTLSYSGEEIATVEVVAVSDVKRSFSKYNLEAAKRFIGSKWFSTALKISIILSLLYIALCIYSLIMFKRRAKPLKPVYAVPKINKKKKNDK